MARQPTENRSIDVVEGTSAALVGGGILTFALFPLALPLIALTVVAALPFLVAGIAVGRVAAILAAPILLVRRLRGRRRDRVPRPAAEQVSAGRAAVGEGLVVAARLAPQPRARRQPGRHAHARDDGEGQPRRHAVGGGD